MSRNEPRPGNDARGGGRYLSQGPEDRRDLLSAIGATDIEELFASVPPNLRYSGELPVEPALSESELGRLFDELAAANGPAAGIRSFLGAGCYPHFVPAHVDALIQRQEFMTSYTPYQGEVAQGTLQAIFEFQTLVCMLTGMEVSNASVYDGGSAVAEAVLMARRLRGQGGRVLWSEALHPAYREVARTYCSYLDMEFETLPVDARGRTPVAEPADDVVAVLVQQPNFFGVVEDLRAVGAALDGSPARLVVSVGDPVSLALAVPPGEIGADIVTGELQAFGNPMNYGGPLVGFVACRDADKRQLPGRLAGETVDAEDKRGFVLTLSTREQHIRRGKATSNICTNEALVALAACIHMCSLGRLGLRELAEHNLAKADYARRALTALDGVEAAFDGPVFNEFTLRLPCDADRVVGAAIERGVVPGLSLGRFFPERRDHLLVCATEVHSRDEIDGLVEAVAESCR